MAKLYLRGKVYYAEYRDAKNVRRVVSTRTADRKVAAARARDLELATTGAAPDSTETLATSADYYLNVDRAGSRPSTLSCYRGKARHLARLLGDVQTAQLKRVDVDHYVTTRLAEGAHTHTVHKELVVLRGVLKSARQREVYRGSLEVIPKIRTGYEPRRTWLTVAEVGKLADHLVPDAKPGASVAELREREERRQQRAFILLLLCYAGPRWGELLALRWEVHVPAALTHIQIPAGKTRSRAVPIHPVLRPWLVARGAAAGWRGPLVDDWHNVRRDLAQICERAKVQAVTPHDLRRTYASWLVQSGASNLLVARLLGHSTTRMVDEVYGQIDLGTLRRAVDLLPAAELSAPATDRSSPVGDLPELVAALPSVDLVLSGSIACRTGVANDARRSGTDETHETPPYFGTSTRTPARTSTRRTPRGR